MADCCTHPALEPLPLFESERVCLGDDGNHVDLVVNGLHELNIQGFQAGWTGDRRQETGEWHPVKDGLKI